LKSDDVLVIKRHKNGDDYYVFPGGGVEGDETTEAAAQRELFEETSIKANIRMLLLHDKREGFRETYFYLCDYVSGEPELGDFNEKEHSSEVNISHPMWVATNQLPDNLLPDNVREALLTAIESR
jgi:8-oxo-dGTP diphosphatase